MAVLPRRCSETRAMQLLPVVVLEQPGERLDGAVKRANGMLSSQEKRRPLHAREGCAGYRRVVKPIFLW